MMTKFSVALFLATVLGLLGGIFVGKAPNAAATTYQYDVWNQPGGNPTLSCGWHTICKGTANNGAALDWGGHAYIYFRSFSDNNAGAGTAGQGLVTWLTTNSGQCNFTYVDLYDTSAVYQGEVLYQHVYSGYTGFRFNIYSGYSPTWTSYYFGYTINEPDNPCQVTGEHVHQQYTSGTWVKNPIYPTMAMCSNNCGTFSVTSLSDYQMERTWFK